MTQLPQHLADKGFTIYANGIARKPNPTTRFGTNQKWFWLARIPSGWVLASSERHARQLYAKGTK